MDGDYDHDQEKGEESGTTSFIDLPEWVQKRILESLDFQVLLKARLVCQSWNAFVSHLIGPNSILNIRLDKSRASKRFRHGKWNGSLMAQYQEVRLIPKPINAFAYGKAKNGFKSSFSNLTHIKRFTLYENGSFLHFVHRYMPHLSRVKYIQIKELGYDETYAKDSKYTYLGHVYSCAVRHKKSWTKAQENLAQVETLRIRLFDRLAALIYIQLFTFRHCSLVNVELDFSKFSGIPLQRYYLNEMNGAICDLLEHCYITLRQLRIRWAVRIDSDIDYARSDEDIEPFFEFLLALRNPVWRKLHLDFLHLSFPTVNLALNLCDNNFFPFLEKIAPRATRINLSRVLPNAGMESFQRKIPPNTFHKFEFNFYFMDGELFPQPVPLIRGVEVLFMNDDPVDQTLIASLSRLRLNGAKHYQSLKLINGHSNEEFTKPNMYVFTEYFPNLKNVELLDSSTHRKNYSRFTTADFNLLVKKLPKLYCLRMANADLEDSEICQVPVEDMNQMKMTGVYHSKEHNKAPVAGAKELKYLDLRDLTPTLTDFSVYFAFQHIKKLEKISFHGGHKITDWGRKLLERVKGKNPSFEVIFRVTDEDHVVFGNYANPCRDFP